MSNKDQSIKYIAFYNDDSFNLKENRNTSLAVLNKMNYIVSALTRNGFDVEIISTCWTENKSGYYKGKKYKLSENVVMKNFATFGAKTALFNQFKKIFSVLQLLIYLLINTEKNEQIIVYHSIALIWPIRIAQKIKKLTLILEVEEVYSEVWDEKKSANLTEIKFIENADKYIFVTEKVKHRFNNKPSTIVHGAYQLLDNKNFSIHENDYINIVYAGSIDETKGGAINSVRCLNYLPNNYRLHILGFGAEKSIEKLEAEIDAINKVKGYKCCIYHGQKTGKEYHEFLFNCDIGLNPQKQGTYMNTAFPSKVLSYLSHNLRVVSTEIKNIKNSRIAPYIFFSKSDEPKMIAESIQSVDFSKSNNGEEIIKKLDKEFMRSIKRLLAEQSR